MRFLTVSIFCLALLCGLQDTACADDLSINLDGAVQSEAPGKADTIQRQDEELLMLLTEDPRVCCILNSIKPIGPNQIVGLLFWSRLRILCPTLRPMAFC
jgi:hypothetical protein